MVRRRPEVGSVWVGERGGSMEGDGRRVTGDFGNDREASRCLLVQ
jgi:hypothetical protein